MDLASESRAVVPTDAAPEAGPRQPTRWQRRRARVQVGFLVGFVLLTLSVWLPQTNFLSHDLFLRFDPLLWLLNSVAAREVARHGLWALALLLVTILLGRVFCGWLCPLGAVLDATRAATGRRRFGAVSQRLGSLRFWLLAALIGAAMAGANFGDWLDPLVMSSRALHLAPVAKGDWTPAAVGWALLLTAVALTLVAPRFWCRALCPLGAALSLAARLSRYRRHLVKTCPDCGACSEACPLGISPATAAAHDCLLCRRCESVCPQWAIVFGFGTSAAPAAPQSSAGRSLDRGRRRLLLGLGGLVVGGVAGVVSKARAGQELLRPPGAADEAQFVSRCIGCGACLAGCPSGGLRPMLALDRLEAAFSPRLVPRIGPCLPDCAACGTACPTGAIARLSLEQKLAVRIGLAVIDQTLCLPWASRQRCVICLDACPPQWHAIELRRVGPAEFRPFVEPSRCTGCGICEHRCPVEGEAAVRVLPFGSSARGKDIVSLGAKA